MARIAIFVLSVLCYFDLTVATQTAQNDSVRAVFELSEESAKDVDELRKKLAPECPKFLDTVLNGRWVPKRVPYEIGWTERKQMEDELQRQKERLDEDMRFVWMKKGIPPDPWSSSSVCGFYRLRKATRLRPSIGTWCNPDGPNPCCNHLLYGRCVPAQQYGGCRCSNCVNVQNMNHAELMDWTPYSGGCKWHQYNPSEACDVIETSPVDELYLVGDSFMQNMYVTMLMLLSGKPVTGAWTKTPLTEEQQELCSNFGMTYWIQCRAMINTLDDMRYRDSLCGNGRNVSFKLEYKKYYSSKFETQFKEFVRGVLGRKGVYVVVGIGFHVGMNLDLAIDHFMEPAMKLYEEYYAGRKGVPVSERWPKFLFSFPLDYGILKPTRHLRRNSAAKQQAFEIGMARYCKQRSIRVLDFTPLVRNVITFDGIHYGIGVNMAKSQIFLNYLASLSNA